MKKTKLNIFEKYMRNNYPHIEEMSADEITDAALMGLAAIAGAHHEAILSLQKEVEELKKLLKTKK